MFTQVLFTLFAVLLTSAGAHAADFKHSAVCQEAIKKAVYAEFGFADRQHELIVGGNDENSAVAIYDLQEMREVFKVWASTEKSGRTCKVTGLDDCGP
jgi:hypothetical protein